MTIGSQPRAWGRGWGPGYISQNSCYFGWAVKVKEELISGSRGKGVQEDRTAMDKNKEVGNSLVYLGNDRWPRYMKMELES